MFEEERSLAKGNRTSFQSNRERLFSMDSEPSPAPAKPKKLAGVGKRLKIIGVVGLIVLSCRVLEMVVRRLARGPQGEVFRRLQSSQRVRSQTGRDQENHA